MKNGYFLLSIIVLFGMAMGASEFVVIGIEPELALAYDVELDTVGLLISWFAIPYAIGTPVLALTTGHFKRYHVLVCYLIVFVLGNLASYIAPSFELLLASRVVIGAVSGAALALCVTLVPEIVPGSFVSMGISIVYASYSVAMVFVTSIGRVVAANWDWRLVLLGVLVLCVVSALAMLAFMPHTGKTDAPATAREQVALFRRPRVLIGMVTFVFGVGSVYVFYGYITPYLEERLLLSSSESALVMVFYGVVCIASNLLSGYMDMRLGFKSLVPNFVLQALFLFALWVAGGNAVGGIACTLLIALSMYTLATPLVSMFLAQSRDHCPKAFTLASSLDPMSFNTGIAVGTYVGGYVVTGIGMGYAGLVGGVFSLIALGLVLANLRLERKENEEYTADWLA